ncbi:hypothetical protein QZM68_08435 [Burkholderia gladioli]|uniref:hypothetical protein n=2 Tax=Burkholderia gladioli TaxID=28095 RepID=UPI00264F1881|nr:hypothetical protein [Burkholderia gladioli]MDN7599781.1 hypothetical protein [Burkholderia gladioli]
MGRSKKNQTKQERERAVFEMFASSFELPAGAISYGDKPDVIIDGARKIGIEITHLYHVDGDDPDSEQVQRRNRKAVVEQAQRLHHAAGGRPVELHFAFNCEVPIRKIKPLAEAIAALGCLIENTASGSVARDLFEHIPQLSWAYWNGREYSNAQWRVTQSYSVPLLSVARVEQAVAEKSEAVMDYTACDEHWLLMIVNFWDPGSDQDISWPAGQVIDPGAFARLLIYKTHFGVVEVPTRSD